MPDPSTLIARLQNASALLQQGRIPQAVAVCQQVLAIQPRSFHALHLLGIAALQLQDFTAADGWLRTAIAADPSQSPAHSNLAVALLALQRPAEALAQADRALQLKGDFAEAWTNRGRALAALQKTDAAVVSYDRALTLNPTLSHVHVSRADLLLGASRLEEALAGYDRALRVNPGDTAALNGRGSALRRLQRPQEAIASYEQVLRLQPNHPEAWSNLANVRLGLGQFDAALRDSARAVALKPDLADALNIRATALRELGRHEEAADGYAQLLGVAPNFPYAAGNHLFARANACAWADRTVQAPAVLAGILAGRQASLPFSFLSVSDSAAAQRLCAGTFIADRCSAALRAWSGSRPRHAKIRVAYVSGDFGEHPVSYLLAGLFERHDAERFDIYAISLRPEQSSPMGRRLKRAFGRFIDVSGLGNREAADLLRELEIDIAVDLAGFTAGMRPEIFALRAAPIQVNYLGYPGTLGADFMDYLIADEFVVPRDLQDRYSEKVVYLPDCFQCNDDRREAATAAPARADLGLPPEGFVFCSFNNNYKINPGMFDVWTHLLRQVPGSVLWLLGSRDAVRDNLRREAQDRGVDPDRIVFAGRLPYAEHLARLRLADLFLDCVPFNGGASASDALSVGLPVLTITGEAFAARMAGSLLTALGLPELITQNLEEYTAAARRFGQRPEDLRELRHRLTASLRDAPLFDTDRFRRHLEMAYERMWLRWQHGDAPESFSVQAASLPRSKDEAG